MTFSHRLAKPPIVSNISATVRLEVQIYSENQPFAGALVFLVARNKESGSLHEHQCVANEQGVGFLNYCPTTETPLYISALSPSGTWYAASQDFKSPATLECPKLEFNSPIQWWHKAVGVHDYDPTLGAGINVGLIDTGCGPHPYLEHVDDLGAIINGKHTMDGADVSYHGTFMAGLIAARPTNQTHPIGIASDVNLSSLRVYGQGAVSANADDVADAICFMATNTKIDLINLSLSSDTVSDNQTAAINKARAAGILCIASAGNTAASPVGYPAATPNVIAVGAMGHNAPGPLPSTNCAFEPQKTAMKGKDGTYLCTVSSYGDQLSCLAPGSAIASTVPSTCDTPLYASLIGSSNSTAIATGILAAALSKDTEYQALPRDNSRAAYAETIFNAMCKTLDMPQKFQGQGLPVLNC